MALVFDAMPFGSLPGRLLPDAATATSVGFRLPRLALPILVMIVRYAWEAWRARTSRRSRPAPAPSPPPREPTT